MSRSKYLLFIAPNLYPCKTGGIEVFNYYLINELKKHYPIHLVSLCDRGNFDDVEIHKLKKRKFPKLTLPFSIFYFIVKNRKSIHMIYASHARSYWTYWAVFILAKKMFGIKYGLTSHGGSKFQKKLKFSSKVLFKNADFLTGVSRKMVEENSKRSSKHVTYTPPLIPFNIINVKNKYRSEWDIAKDEVIMLYVGSLKPLKSADTLIEALGMISLKKLRKFKLKVLIAGDGVSRMNLEKRVAQLELNDIVIFLGNIEREKIDQLYNLADIYTICSEFEGLPIALLEAFANGLPCITSDAPGLIEVSLNNKNTLLFKTKDSRDYSEKILMLLENNELKENLAIEGKKYFEKLYSYDILVNKFKKLIGKIDVSYES